MYKATYKCRMCGETFTDFGYCAEQEASFLALEVATRGRLKGGLKNTVDEKTIHTCPDGSIGYADFVGFRKENDNVCCSD